MKKKSGFTLMNRDEFKSWLEEIHINRYITLIQNHHTYIPDYSHCKGEDYQFTRLSGMKRSHLHRGYSDIAQNLTTFPDGTIALCRPLERAPAGIKGANTRGICIEHVGYFDKGGDEMTDEHRKTIIFLNAVLCKKFNLQPNTDNIVYHHWFDLRSGKRRNGEGYTKSCPGTNFFGGNKVEDAEKHFIPLISKEFKNLGGKIIETPDSIGHGIVSAYKLNVRSKPDINSQRLGVVVAGATVEIFEEKDDWYRIDPNDKWVYGRYVDRIWFAEITASKLNVRTGPGQEYRSLGTIPRGYKVTVYEEKDDWCKIDLEEKWVSKKYLNQLKHAR